MPHPSQPAQTPAPIADVTGQPAAQSTTVGQTDSNVAGNQTPATEANPNEEANASRFAALARQQKLFRNQQKSFEAERRQFEADRDALAESRREIEQARVWKDKLKSDPYGVMLETGLTADQVAGLMLNQPNPQDQAAQRLQAKIDALEAGQEKIRKDTEQAAARQVEEAKGQIRSDVSALVGSDPNFETIKAMNMSESVVELIVKTYDEENRLLTIEQAAQEVEDYLTAEALRFANLNKVKAKLQPAQPQPPAQAAPAAAGQKQPIPTLSTRVTQSYTTTKPATDKERRERAIQAFMQAKAGT